MFEPWKYFWEIKSSQQNKIMNQNLQWWTLRILENFARKTRIETWQRWLVLCYLVNEMWLVFFYPFVTKRKFVLFFLNCTKRQCELLTKRGRFDLLFILTFCKKENEILFKAPNKRWCSFYPCKNESWVLFTLCKKISEYVLPFVR